MFYFQYDYFLRFFFPFLPAVGYRNQRPTAIPMPPSAAAGMVIRNAAKYSPVSPGQHPVGSPVQTYINRGGQLSQLQRQALHHQQLRYGSTVMSDRRFEQQNSPLASSYTHLSVGAQINAYSYHFNVQAVVLFATRSIDLFIK